MKWLQVLGTTLLCVAVSFLTTSIVLRHQGVAAGLPQAQPKVVQAQRVDLLDSKGRVRATIGVAETDGRETPQLIFRNEDGGEAVIVSVDRSGQGTLYFSSPKKEGKVAVGWIWGSDTPSPGEIDPLGFWGMRVLGSNGRAEAFGSNDDDRRVSSIR